MVSEKIQEVFYPDELEPDWCDTSEFLRFKYSTDNRKSKRYSDMFAIDAQEPHDNIILIWMDII